MGAPAGPCNCCTCRCLAEHLCNVAKASWWLMGGCVPPLLALALATLCAAGSHRHSSTVSCNLSVPNILGASLWNQYSNSAKAVSQTFETPSARSSNNAAREDREAPGPDEERKQKTGQADRDQELQQQGRGSCHGKLSMVHVMNGKMLHLPPFLPSASWSP